MEKVDVVIPTYQEKERLLSAVKSVENQDFPVNKIFVVDDGSDQETVAFLESNLAKNPSITLIKLEHSGLPGLCRRVGVENSNADWIAFLDADDEWIPSKTSMQLQHAREASAALICSNAWSVEGNKVSKFFSNPAIFLRPITPRLASRNLIINSSVMVRRQALAQIGIYCDSMDVRGVEDYATWLRVSTIGKIVGLGEPLLYYRVSPDGLSKNSNGTQLTALTNFLRWSKDLPEKTFVVHLRRFHARLVSSLLKLSQD